MIELRFKLGVVSFFHFFHPAPLLVSRSPLHASRSPFHSSPSPLRFLVLVGVETSLTNS